VTPESKAIFFRPQVEWLSVKQVPLMPEELLTNPIDPMRKKDFI